MNLDAETSPDMSFQTVTENDFQSEVLAAPLPVLVDFATHWCAPCRALQPILRALEAERPGRLRVCTVDAETNRALADRYDVRSFPTVIAFSEGRVVGRLVGLTTREKLLKLLEKR